VMALHEMVATALVRSLVIGVLLVPALAIAFRHSRRFSASTRAAAWATAIFVCTAIPVAWAIASAATSPRGTSATASPHGSRHVVGRLSVASFPASPASITGSAASPSVRGQTRANVRLTMPVVVLQSIAVAWATGAGLLLLRLALQYAALLRELSLLPAPSPHVEERVRSALRRTGLRRRVRFAVSNDYASPAVAGWVRPVIVLPSAVLELADATALERVVAHEAAHLARGDDYADLAVRIALALAFFNPALWFARRRLELDREIACDDRVLRGCADQAEYARLLVHVARRGSPSPGLALTSSPHQLVRRVEAILTDRRNRSLHSLPGIAAAAALTVLPCLLALNIHTAASAEPATANGASPAHGEFDNPMALGSTLHLYNYAGNVTVKRTDGDRIRIEALAVRGSEGELPTLRFSGTGADPVACATAGSKRAAVSAVLESLCNDRDVLDGPPVQRVDWTVALPAGRNVAIHDGSGAIVVRADGDVEVRDGDGNVDASGRIVDVTTKRGDIVATLSSPSFSRWVTLDARHGTLAVTVPRALRAQIVATSFAGSIRSAIPMSLGKEPGYDALIGRATLRGASEQEKLILMAGSTITVVQE
jgi:beta-lactamase regulating signal transducer with metallopeptidase domain